MASSALIGLVGDGADLEAMRFTRRDITRHGRSLQALSKMLATAHVRDQFPGVSTRQGKHSDTQTE
jgi:hypothetical protein